MSASTDKICPRSVRSGLSALGSGGQHFEEGSHLCFIILYFKKYKNESTEVQILGVIRIQL